MNHTKAKSVRQFGPAACIASTAEVKQCCTLSVSRRVTVKMITLGCGFCSYSISIPIFILGNIIYLVFKHLSEFKVKIKCVDIRCGFFVYLCHHGAKIKNLTNPLETWTETLKQRQKSHSIIKAVWSAKILAIRRIEVSKGLEASEAKTNEET